MTGMVPPKPTQKTLQKQSVFKNETLQDSFENYSQATPKAPAPPKFSLGGILGLNQTIELNKSTVENKSEKVIFATPRHLETEAQQIRAEETSRTEQAVKELLSEIKKLLSNTQNATQELIVAADAPVVEANEYELTVLQRLANVIRLVTRSVGEVCLWAESFNSKKKKKNFFWKKSLNKKGGQAFMFSDEHSASRSVN